MYTTLFLGLLPFAAAQVAQVTEAPPPPPVRLTATKSGVIPSLPSGTPFAGVDTLQGAIMMPLPPQPGYVGLDGTATAQTNQPTATYRATLPSTMFNPLVGSVVSGYIEGVGTANGVRFTVSLGGLPSQAQYGPFNWHIHTMPVPANGNCTATLSHLDPTNRGELIMCEAARPETCQVGDLAGKHGGKIMTPGNFSTSFVDAYLSTQAGTPAFFGGLGFVLHSANTTRLTCANFVQVNGTSGGNVTSPTGPSPSQYTGAAAKMGAGIGAAALAIACAAFAL